jgi:hypothetical protein
MISSAGILLAGALWGAVFGLLGVWVLAVLDLVRIAVAHWRLRQTLDAVRYAALVLVFTCLPVVGIAAILRLLGGAT